MLEKIDSIVKTFFDKLDIELENIETTIQEENIFSIKIKSPNSGILIGNHGKNLNSIEQLLRQMVSNILNQKIKLHIEVNDYVESKDERLYNFIKSKVNYLKDSNTNDIKLPFLTAYERKKVHFFISELNDDNIYTKSTGEGKDRRLHIYKKDKSVTIDIDGNDI